MDLHQPEFTDDQALAWLTGQPSRSIETSVSALARLWGWNRTRVLRRLRQWASEGQIARAQVSSGRSIITVEQTSDYQTRAIDNGQPAPTPDFSVPQAVKSALVPFPRHWKFSAWSILAPKIIMRSVGTIVLSALSVAIAWFGIQINAWYGATLGKTAEAGTLLAGLSISADILALILPTTARVLWSDRQRVASGIAWGLWTMTILTALLATVGFAALNITDTTAARSQITAERATLTARVERLRSERAGIAENRPVASIEVELQRAQPSASAVWRATSGCHDVTLPSSGDACATVLALRQALQTARGREDLDAELREAEKEISRLPAISISDPQAEIAANLLKWVTVGLIDISADDIRIARIGGMTVMPQVAGLVLMLAAALWQSRAQRGAS
jgi:hypothetical protein